MSYLPIKQQNEDAPEGETTADPSSQIPEGSGGSVGAESGGAAAAGSSTGTPTQFGSSASKLGDYLSANAPQIGQQADKISGQLNTQYNQLNQGITNAANQFGQQVQGGYNAPDQNIVNQALANPNQFVQDPNNVKAFQGQYNNQYTGPQNFESTSPYSQIQGQVQSAVQQGGLLQNQAGLQSYLQGQQKNPTRASATLDSLLLRGNPEAQQKVKTAGQQFNNLTGQLEQAKTAGNQQVDVAKTAANTSKQYAQDTVAPAVANWQKTLTDQVANNEKQRGDYNTNIASILAKLSNGQSGTLTASEVAQLNANYPEIVKFNNLAQINNDSYGGATNVNLANYLQGSLNPDNNIATAANSATPQDYSTANAYSQLLGQNFNNPLTGTAPTTSWSLPTSTGASLNTSGALEDEIGALKLADQQLVAAHGNPTFAANGNPQGLMASDPMDVYKVIDAMRRLANPDLYNNVDPTLQPNTPLPPGVTLGGGTTPTSGGGRATR